MKKFVFSCLLFGSFATKVIAQQFPVFTQYMANPYVINPGYIAITGRPEINLSYRQQWTGFEDGPQTIQGDVQFPLNKKISLGVNVINDKTVLLSQFNGFATFGYRVPLTSKQQLSFGLSAGVVSNQLKLDQVPGIDLNDPVIKNAVNNLDFDGQFGMVYAAGKFSLGLSLLKLVKSTPFYNGEALQDYEFDPFKDKAAFISYRFDISRKISFQPYFLYRTTYTGFEYYEGTGLFNISNTVTIGGGYRTDSGPIVMLRFRISKARLGYAYDFPSNKYGAATQGTNEVQMKWLFGEEPVIIAEEKVEEETPITEAKNEEPVVQPEQEAVVVTPPVEEKEPAVVEEPQQVAVVVTEPVVEKQEEAKPVAKKWYLIVGTFEKKYNAERLIKNYEREGVHAEMILHDNYYYVHIPEFATNEITVERVMEIRQTTSHTDAWFKQLDN